MSGATGRPVTLRIGTRIERLEGLVDSDATDIAKRARKQVIAAIPSPVSIIVRSGLFAHLAGGESGHTRIQQISTPKGAAVKVLLLALFELQVRKARKGGPHPRTKLPLQGSGDELPGWIQLAALPTVDSTTTRTHPRKPAGNRLRQIKAALDRLEEFGRVELGKPGSHGRYEKFRILNEAVTNSAQHGLTGYIIPDIEGGRARRKVVTVPIEFFLNGWIDALTDNEIITYLALRLLAQAFPDRHADTGVYLTAADRESTFGLDRGFEAHRMLSRYGLITTKRDPRRNADGTIPRHDKIGDGLLHRFTLCDHGLQQDAVAWVIKSLERYASGFSSDDAKFADLFDQTSTKIKIE